MTEELTSSGSSESESGSFLSRWSKRKQTSDQAVDVGQVALESDLREKDQQPQNQQPQIGAEHYSAQQGRAAAVNSQALQEPLILETPPVHETLPILETSGARPPPPSTGRMITDPPVSSRLSQDQKMQKRRADVSEFKDSSSDSGLSADSSSDPSVEAGTESTAVTAVDAEQGEVLLTDADMPDLETLDANSDYSGFLGKGISKELRQKALARLFSMPKFNIRDGLNDYDEDYTYFEPLGDTVTSDMKWHAARKIREEEERVQAEQLAAQAEAEQDEAERDEAEVNPEQAAAEEEAGLERDGNEKAGNEDAETAAAIGQEEAGADQACVSNASENHSQSKTTLLVDASAASSGADNDVVAISDAAPVDSAPVDSALVDFSAATDQLAIVAPTQFTSDQTDNNAAAMQTSGQPASGQPVQLPEHLTESVLEQTSEMKKVVADKASYPTTRLPVKEIRHDD